MRWPAWRFAILTVGLAVACSPPRGNPLEQPDGQGRDAEEHIDAGAVSPGDVSHEVVDSSVTGSDGRAGDAKAICDCGNATCPANGCGMATCSSSADCQPDDFCSNGKCVNDVRQVAAGPWHTCALQKKGSVMCWGSNESGQLGTGQAQGKALAPTTVQGLPPAGRLALGAAHSCALTLDGRVFCWGNDVAGQLGDGGGANRGSAAPVKVSVGGQDLLGVSAVASGACHTCAIASGGVYCWGCNSNGQLAQPPDMFTLSKVPVLVAGSGAATKLVSGEQSVGYLEAARFCGWGWNKGKQVAATSDTDVVSPICTDLAGVTDLTMGTAHGCARLATGEARCWGYVIGSNVIGAGPPGTSIAGFTFSDLVAGSGHECGRSSDGQVHCWGFNASGRLGDGGTEDRTVPTSPVIEDDGSVMTHVLLGGLGSGSTASHTCAIIDDGSLRCWGSNEKGQLGTGVEGGQSERAIRVKW